MELTKKYFDDSEDWADPYEGELYCSLNTFHNFTYSLKNRRLVAFHRDATEPKTFLTVQPKGFPDVTTVERLEEIISMDKDIFKED
jgi:hypothetical protein